MSIDHYIKDCNTIPEAFNKTVNRFPDKIALQIKREGEYYQLTYSELKGQINLIGAALVAQGLKPGDHAAVIGENRPEWAISYLAIQFAGATVIPLDAMLKTQEMFHILFDSNSTFLLASGKFLGDISDIRPNLKELEYLISMDSFEETYKGDAIFWPDFLAAGKKALESGSSDYPNRKATGEDLAAIIYTSGTTGQSKGVELSHNNIVSDVKEIPSLISFTEEDNFISILPLHHVFEATAGFITPISNGCTITYSPSLKSKEIIGTIKEKGCTVMLGVPLLYEKMAAGIKRSISQKPLVTRALFNTSLKTVQIAKSVFKKQIGNKVFAGLRNKAGLQTIRIMVSGGAALTPEVGEVFQDLGFTILQGYGLTETAPVVTANPLKRVKIDSVGLPLPSAEIKINEPDEEGKGEIIVRGPMIMKGYYKNPVATDEVIKDGWFYTGDLGRFDEDGYLYVTGRSKNLIVTKAGKNIYPEEVETVLMKSPFILEVIVVGRMKGDREEVTAIVVPDSEYFDTYAKQHGIVLNENKVNEIVKVEISKHCSTLSDYKRVKNFEIREEEFPKTSKKSIKRYLFQRKTVKV